ncbi:two-component system CheB/CheR fusion protein [Catenuloplanes nepalensis]|uniref:protein-glutamate O-methyltransferase n=1 Tax=Catenuloplanes nepalensis TaxID=587533 RepID=A0ABT9N6U8_9ACTN|nr:CheR family methyltransferase [Catenuloplanes nepalensis]MDP9799414.1 two-component system CheB/CheR fusion protein [Catenuloplanes nepalensis]
MDQAERQFEELLIHLKEARGFDFTGYKRSSLVRRVGRRMAALEITEYADYVDHLQVYPDEFTALFNTILINVTSFFRDPEAWDSLRRSVLEPLVAAKGPDAPIRLWSTGCASGEEAYTLAILLGEVLGVEQMRDRVKIYATDVDEEQLTEARHATYDATAIASVPPELVAKYFEAAGQRYQFRPDLRRTVIFGRNDLVQDAPISRIDVLTCRNTLMYFTPETQARILARFHFALADGGTLFLGRAETLRHHDALFLPTDIKHRIFRRTPRAASGSSSAGGWQPPVPRGADGRAGVDQLRNAAMLASPVAQIVVTPDGLVALSNQQAERLFGVSVRDVGRPFQDLDVSYRPVELRPYIEQALTERRTVGLKDVRHHSTYFEVQVTPLREGAADPIGVAVVFQDVTAARKLHDDLETANRELATAYEELQSTNEELETTNEELQSTVEELETTNEELQSTNEELETTNEELESTNEKLESTNGELQNSNERLRLSTAELDGANAFLDAVLSHLRAGIVVVDQSLKIRAWNRRAEDLWGLRSHEAVGEHLLNLDIGLPVDRLRPLIRQSLGGETEPGEMRLEAVNRRGRHLAVRVACSPMLDDGVPVGAILVMEE